MTDNLTRAAPALLSALEECLIVMEMHDKRESGGFNIPEVVFSRIWVGIEEHARAVILQAKRPDIDPVSGLPWNRDGGD